MRKIFLGEMTSKELSEAIDEDTTVILPVGATEVCGQHCPVGNDHMIAKEIAGRLGEKTKTVVAPTIPVGDSFSLMGFRGTLTVNTDTLYRYIRDICLSLAANGFRRIFFLNTHLHNIYPIDRVARELKSKGILTAQVDFWRLLHQFAKGSGLVESKEFEVGHGGEINTSVVMALFPNLVDVDSAKKELPGSSLQSKYLGKISMYRDLIDYSMTGTVGHPELATVEKGKVFVDKVLESLVQFMNDFKAEPLPAPSDPLTKKKIT